MRELCAEDNELNAEIPGRTVKIDARNVNSQEKWRHTPGDIEETHPDDEDACYMVMRQRKQPNTELV